MPAENLISPEAVRQAMWHNPKPDDGIEYVMEKLREAGARSWQVELVAPHLVRPLHETVPLPPPPAPEIEVAEGTGSEE